MHYSTSMPNPTSFLSGRYDAHEGWDEDLERRRGGNETPHIPRTRSFSAGEKPIPAVSIEKRSASIESICIKCLKITEDSDSRSLISVESKEVDKEETAISSIRIGEVPFLERKPKEKYYKAIPLLEEIVTNLLIEKIRDEDLSTVKDLLEAGADPLSSSAEDGVCPQQIALDKMSDDNFHYALKIEMVEIMSLLVQYSSSPNIHTSSDAPILMDVIFMQDSLAGISSAEVVEFIKRFVSAGIDIDDAYSSERTPLYVACVSTGICDPNIIDTLLMLGASPNPPKCDSEDNNPLYGFLSSQRLSLKKDPQQHQQAVKGRVLRVVQSLVEEGADITSSVRQLFEPLLQNGYNEVVSYLDNHMTQPKSLKCLVRLYLRKQLIGLGRLTNKSVSDFKIPEQLQSFLLNTCWGYEKKMTESAGRFHSRLKAVDRDSSYV